MKTLKYVFAAATLLALVNPALAQTDPHHPAATATAAPAGAPAATAPQEASSATPPMAAAPAAGGQENMPAECRDMMGKMAMMQQGKAGTPDTQMMQMMQMMMSMQMMQMNLMRQMQNDMMQGGEAEEEKGSP